jgi:hypothetical protein
MAGFIGVTWDFGTVTGSALDSEGFSVIQTDNYGGGGNAYGEHHSLYGFASWPADPDPDGTGAQAMYAQEGNALHCIVLDDPRATAKLPKRTKGGSAQYGATGTFDYINGENGTKLVYVPYAFDGNGKATKAMAINLDVTNAGHEAMHIVHGEGMGIVMSADDKSVTIKNKAGNAYIRLDDSGITLFGSIRMTGGIVAGQGAPKPAAMAVPVVTDLTKIMAYLAEVQAWMALAGAKPSVGVPPPVVPPPVTPDPTIPSTTLVG